MHYFFIWQISLVGYGLWDNKQFVSQNLACPHLQCTLIYDFSIDAYVRNIKSAHLDSLNKMFYSIRFPYNNKWCFWHSVLLILWCVLHAPYFWRIWTPFEFFSRISSGEILSVSNPHVYTIMSTSKHKPLKSVGIHDYACIKAQMFYSSNLE